MSKNENFEKFERLEEKYETLDTKVTTLDTRLTVLEMQVGRLTSHIESEVGLARNDLARIEKKLFGEDDKKYSGRIGEISKDIDNFKFKLAYGAGFVGALLFVLEIYRYIRR